MHIPKLQILLVMALAVAAAAQDNAKASADKSMILALENAWNQAELHHDASAVDALVAETFISVDHHGHLQTKAQYIADLKDTSIQSRTSLEHRYERLYLREHRDRHQCLSHQGHRQG
jgi:hypothetical protein